MKQNTKFLWMYIGILFSFALILIIFAGMSRNTDTEQKEGLKADIAALSAQNTTLRAETTNLKAQIDALIAENETLKASDAAFAEAEILLASACEAYDRGDKKASKEILAAIDTANLTQSQLYIYDMLTN